MKKLIGSWILMNLAVALYGQSPERGLRIEVLVYNYAGVSAETLAHAEREAARIYQRAGLVTEWMDCALSPAEAAQYPACGLPSAPTRFILRLLTSAMAQRLVPDRNLLGLALLPENGGFGVTANVCAERAWERAHIQDLSRSLVLGLLVAHELGHLLIGKPGHAASGVMSVAWKTGTPVSITRGMYFLSQQAKQIRANVAARIASQQAAEARLSTSK